MIHKYSILYAKVLRVGIAAIMLIAPFYAPLSVWLASRLQHLDFWKIWKEFALTLLGLVLFSFLLAHHKRVLKILRSKLLVLSLAYTLLVLVYGTYALASDRVSNEAVIFGLIVDLRPVAMFVVALTAFAIAKRYKLPSFPWRKILLWPALIVVVFGLLQLFVLPNDILSHIGYGEGTIKPYQTVDNQPDIVRIQSSMRGPNPLGAYLVIIITALSVLFVANKKHRLKWGMFISGSVIVLAGTYSRSAQLGLALSLMTLALIHKNRFIKQHLVIAGAILALVLSITTVAVIKNSYIAENFFFHTSNSSTSTLSSNSQRLSAMQTAASDIIKNPLGGGTGSAGPASGRNSMGKTKIAENYYLQIGQEYGLVGMGLFIAINVAVGYELWKRRRDQLAGILFASFIGLSFINLVSHAWTDDALAYIWWGLAGLALSPLLAFGTDKSPPKQLLNSSPPD